MKLKNKPKDFFPRFLFRNSPDPTLGVWKSVCFKSLPTTLPTVVDATSPGGGSSLSRAPTEAFPKSCGPRSFRWRCQGLTVGPPRCTAAHAVPVNSSMGPSLTQTSVVSGREFISHNLGTKPQSFCRQSMPPPPYHPRRPARERKAGEESADRGRGLAECQP